ncbi:MAG: tRNA preQ1(34) S-adenosylmethionine ribosyltransferase-isomerase QueA [Candidatus Omnitrophica bacterium]|nr:tRNA preQ1(34) S-adenosylmethionine ribosyltransferase-isomerase QueA [Candidatus Omnitrophota bacterium]
MKLSDFDYNLPEGLIAQYPLKERDASRMLVLERSAEKIYEKAFKDLTNYLNAGDTIVLNDVKVMPARLLGKKDTGAKIELFLLEKIKDNVYKVLAKPSKRLKPGAKVIFKDGVSATVLGNADFGKTVQFSAPEEKLREIAQVPLPPYITRNPEKSDEERYQTVYAKSNGATASPTAGLHFTEAMLNEIKAKGINVCYVTLNVSYGTFAPVLEDEIEDHKMHEEWFNLTQDTADIVNETKNRKNKVLAVGTTTARTLETCALEEGTVAAKEGRTGLFIYPGYKFKIVDELLTNFHIPKSTLLMLVSAFVGREFILDAYKKAVESKFRFFSYGDCMLIV